MSNLNRNKIMKTPLEAYQYNVINLSTNVIYLERLHNITKDKLSNILKKRPEDLPEKVASLLDTLQLSNIASKLYLDKIDDDPDIISKNFILKLEETVLDLISHIKTLNQCIQLLEEATIEVEEEIEPAITSEIAKLALLRSKIERPIVNPISSTAYLDHIDSILREILTSKTLDAVEA